MFLPHQFVSAINRNMNFTHADNNHYIGVITNKICIMATIFNIMRLNFDPIFKRKPFVFPRYIFDSKTIELCVSLEVI